MTRRETLETDSRGQAPDAGLAAIAAGFAARLGVPPTAGPAEADPAGPVSAPRHLVRPEECWPLRLMPANLTAAGTIDPVDWGPRDGRAWHITEVVITLGAGATLAQVYDEAAQPVNLLFQTTVSGLWEPRQKILLAGERLVFVFTGGGGTVRMEGVQMMAYFLPTYLA